MTPKNLSRNASKIYLQNWIALLKSTFGRLFLSGKSLTSCGVSGGERVGADGEFVLIKCAFKFNL